MQLSELLPAMITALAPTGPLPNEPADQLAYWRQLVTKRRPGQLEQKYLAKEDQFLKLLWQKHGHKQLSELSQTATGIYLTQGDLTRLKVDAIVNAASADLLGCFDPNHTCLDNEIHVLAGSRLREECAKLMQHSTLKAGQVRITDAYHLPAKHVIHAVSPKIPAIPTLAAKQQLAACYEASLTLALEHRLTSIAFCSLGTGRKNFPRPLAAQIALEVAQKFHTYHPELAIVFCPYTDIDYNLYRYLLAQKNTNTL